MAGDNLLMTLLGVGIGWFIVAPVVSGPVMQIIDKIGSTVQGAVGGQSAGSTGGGAGSGSAPRGGKGGGGSPGYSGYAQAMVGGMLTHYPN